MPHLTYAQMFLAGGASLFNLGLVALSILTRFADQPQRPLAALGGHSLTRHRGETPMARWASSVFTD